MDHSTATLGPLSSARQERRRRVRHKLYTPVFVSFNGPQTGIVVDLSELLDLTEDGFAVQTAPQKPPPATAGTESKDGQGAEPLEVNRPVTLCLDLSETKSYVHGSGVVVWRDDSGRVGIRFSFLPDRAVSVLKEWLFVNMLIACSNHAARSEQLAHYRQDEPSGPQPMPAAIPFPVAIPERAQLLSALDDVRREVREMEAQAVEGRLDSTNPILQLITERAMALTGATGSAVALLTDGRMICRARCGDPAPPLGAEVNVEEGLSGECVRTGKAVRCEDTACDPRVDPELCRALGLASFLAVPIASDFHVIGLLEVFSPQPRIFGDSESATLQRLAELIPRIEAQHTGFERSGTKTAEAPGTASPAAGPAIAELAASESVASESAPARTTEIGPDIRPEAHAGAAAETEHRTSPATGAVSPELSTASPLHDVRDALWEAEPEPEERSGSERLEAESEGERKVSATSLKAHFGLLLSSLAAVALVLGYVMAPVIERHLNGGAQSAQTSAAELPVAYTMQQSSKAAAATPEDLRKMAENGDAEAQWRLGTLYRNGDGLPQSDAQAVEWFQRSAEQEYTPALSALGSHYWAGRGVRQDYAKAYFWYRLALAEGDQNSKLPLEGLAAQLTRQQVNNVQLEAEAWLNAHSQMPKRAEN